MTSSEDKTHEKKFLEPNVGQNGPKSAPKLGGFLPFFQVWFISISLNCIG